MSQFNFKSLTFYAVAIGLVVFLFKAVTTYGESNLKAPQSIDGRYQFNVKNPPQCLKDTKLMLDIQQSGVYLNGSLVTITNTGKSQQTTEKPSLMGQFKQQKVVLSGLVPHLTGCQNQSVTIQGLVDQQTLKGQIILSSISKVFNFTAKKEALSPQQKGLEKH